MRRERLVIIGNGMATTRLLEELLGQDAQRLHITVISAEAGGGYNRILLSPWLCDEKSDAQVHTHPEAWYAEHGIHLITADAVTRVDSHNRCVRTVSGRHVLWDHLVFATGSQAARLSIPGADLPAVYVLRDWQDAQRLRQRSALGGRCVVIGGGLLGLEAAWALARAGVQVTVVHNSAWLMNRQLDAQAGALLASSLASAGISLVTCAHSAAFLASPEGQLQALQLSDGRVLDCDFALMSLGIRPEIRLAQATGLHCQRAICVDGWLQTSHAQIYALGECCEIDGEGFGLVAPIYQQAAILAKRLLQLPTAGFVSKTLPTRLKISGLQVFAAGDVHAAEDARNLIWSDPIAGHYRRLIFQDGQLHAAVLVGVVEDGGVCADLIAQASPVASPERLALAAGAVA